MGLMTGLVSLVMYALGFYTGKESCRSGGTKFLLAAVLFIFLAEVSLLVSILNNDFGFRYVALYSDRTLPLIYKISVLWAGQSGALLTACVLISFFILIDIKLNKFSHIKYSSAVSFVNLLFVMIFLALSVFVVNPFVQLEFVPVNGRGLFPVLQNKYIFLYPLFTCFWAAGALMIFSHAVATLALRDITPQWVRSTYGWVVFSWISVVVAVASRSIWTYEISGSFWKWSIGETAGILSMLSLVAFIYTSHAYTSRGRMKTGTFLCALLFFEAALFALYIVHSGQEVGITPFKYTFCGVYIVAAMFFFFVAYMLLLTYNRNLLYNSKLTVNKREYTFFKIINILFALVVFCIFFGLVLLILSDIFMHPYGYKLVVAVTIGLFTVFFIIVPQLYPFFDSGKGFLWKKRLKSPFTATFVGMLIIVTVAILSHLNKWNSEVALHSGELVKVNGITIVDKWVSSAQRDNYVSTFVDISLSSDKKMIGNIQPEIRGYNNSGELIADTDTVFYKLGVISVAFLSYDFLSGKSVLFIMNRPFVLLMIPGILIFAFGILWTAAGNRKC